MRCPENGVAAGEAVSGQAPQNGEEHAASEEAPCNGHATASATSADVKPEAAAPAEPEPVPGTF